MYSSPVRRVPKSLGWLFWETSPGRLSVTRDRDYILARVLEFGTMKEVRWAVKTWGRAGLLDFFRNTRSPEISERTRAFWRVALDAKDETWRGPSDFRKSSSAFWVR